MVLQMIDSGVKKADDGLNDDVAMGGVGSSIIIFDSVSSRPNRSSTATDALYCDVQNRKEIASSH